MSDSPVAAVAERRMCRADAWRTLRGAVARAAVFAAAAVALFTWVFGLVVVQGDGMEPASGDGDVALMCRLHGQLAVDDLVVYRGRSGEELVGRVVALPGDTVQVTDDGTVMLNGADQPDMNGQKALPSESGPAYPLVLGEGEYFVLGDNRSSAVDSREMGAIGINEVEGKVIALLRLRNI